MRAADEKLIINELGPHLGYKIRCIVSNTELSSLIYKLYSIIMCSLAFHRATQLKEHKGSTSQCLEIIRLTACHVYVHHSHLGYNKKRCIVIK